MVPIVKMIVPSSRYYLKCPYEMTPTRIVDSPKVDGCTLVDKNDSTVDYTINNTDYQKTVYYTCKAENPAVNPKTGNALIFVAWVVGLSSLGYSIYWFKKNKKEEV